MNAVIALAAFVVLVFATRRALGQAAAPELQTGRDLALATRKLPPGFVVESEDAPTEESGTFTPAKARRIVERMNRTRFNGWFKPADVLAVIQVESNFDPRASRFEPKLGEHSTGLMQLLESTAADRGYRGRRAGLFDPERNIALGMAHLKWSHDFLSARDPDISVDQWISSYNAGVGNTLKGFVAHTYVRRWRAARERFS